LLKMSSFPIYVMFLSLVFLAELVAGISGFVFRHEIKGTFQRTFSEAVKNYNSQDERSLAVDNVQRSLKCCGVLNYTSWLSSIWFPNNGIPPSCCANTHTDRQTHTVHTDKHTHLSCLLQGCYELV
uniref:Tetraspanin 7 n=1 Tax=Hucho hucho TaxID=62062 RepID=A0A4W5PVI9_9TELE